MKTTGLFFLFLLLMNFCTFGQENTNAIKTDIGRIFQNVFFIQYEHAFSQKRSGQIGVGIYSKNQGYLSTSTGTIIQSEYRFYTHEVMDKFYWGPLAIFGFYQANIDALGNRTNVNSSQFGIGAKAGWCWIVGNQENILIDTSLGLYASHVSSNVGKYEVGTRGGLNVLLSISIGYSF